MSSKAQHQLRVLFVDDDSAIRKVMGIELPRMGHDVTICESGEQALDVIEKNTYDTAIVDLRMPGISGWEVVDAIKENAPTTDVIISTGHGNMNEAIKALRMGAYDFLPKPCQLYEISNVPEASGRETSTHS